nr:MAG TPA_asm: head to tail adaptor [Caudoviricetes sp.]
MLMARNRNLPTVSDFRRDFRQFSDDTKYPDAVIEFRLNLADMLIDGSAMENMFPYLAELFVAHYMVLNAADTAAGALGGAGGTTSGVVASKSVDKVSVSYDNSATLNADAGFWNFSRYGAEFWQLLMLFGYGGVQL